MGFAKIDDKRAKEAMAQMSGGSGFLKLVEGQNIIRLVGLTEAEAKQGMVVPILQVWSHFVGDSSYICLKKQGLAARCHLCDAKNKVNDLLDEEEVKNLAARKRNRVKAINVESTREEIKIFEYGTGIQDDFSEIIQEHGASALFDEEEAYAIRLTRKGAGLRTRYKTTLANRKTALPDWAFDIMETKPVNLHDTLEVLSDDVYKEVAAGILESAGYEGPRSRRSRDEDDDDDDAGFSSRRSSRRSRRDEDEDEEDEAPRSSSRRSRRDADEDEEEAPRPSSRRSRRDDDEDEEPRSRRSTSRRSRDEDEDEPDEEEKVEVRRSARAEEPDVDDEDSRADEVDGVPFADDDDEEEAPPARSSRSKPTMTRSRKDDDDDAEVAKSTLDEIRTRNRRGSKARGAA